MENFRLRVFRARIAAEQLLLTQQENPQVEISVMGGNTQTILEALVEHRVQLCLIEGPPMRRDLQVESFMEHHMVCVVRLAGQCNLCGQTGDLSTFAVPDFLPRIPFDFENLPHRESDARGNRLATPLPQIASGPRKRSPP